MPSILRSLTAQGYIYRGGRSAVSRQSRNFCSSNVASFNEAGRGRFFSAAAAWWNSVTLFDGFLVGSGCYTGYELIRVFNEYMISKRAQEELNIRDQRHKEMAMLQTSNRLVDSSSVKYVTSLVYEAPLPRHLPFRYPR